MRVFRTHQKASAFIEKQGKLEDIIFDGVAVGFEFSISEEKIEHREKYSMGGGYYLKDGGRHCTGWKIYKVIKGDNWGNGLYVSMGQRCIFQEGGKG